MEEVVVEAEVEVEAEVDVEVDVELVVEAEAEVEAEVEVDVGDPRGSDSRRWLHLAGPGTVRAAARCPALDLRSRQHARR